MWQKIRAFLDSLSGRTIVVLTIGIASASIVSLLIAEHYRIKDFKRLQLERVAISVADISDRFARDPVRTTELIRDHRIFGAQEAPDSWTVTTVERELGDLLAARLGPKSSPTAMLMPRNECFPNLNLSIRAAGMNETSLPDCYFVRFRDAGGVQRRLSVDITAMQLPKNSGLDPVFLCLIVIASACLSVLVARFTIVPLRRLTQAARTFSVMVDPETIPEKGPSEIRAALQTFNIMQARVNEGFRERTQLLASIAHDLQTPLTRLRLRVEEVGDDRLRQRLIADLTVTQQLVRDGLDLARSNVSEEPWSMVDLDSMLSSIAEDAVEFGNQVRFTGGCGAQVRVKPNALLRCLTNLVDNAIKYAGDAELSCRTEADTLVIDVRDHGPGIPTEKIDIALQPFKRLEQATERTILGTGIGLTIARAQAETFGATLSLANHPEAGFIARLTLRA